MDIQKPQRKTVQWDAQEIKINIIDKHQDFKKKVLEFETVKSKVHNQSDQYVNQSENSRSDDQLMEEKSQKTIEMELNLKKAKINRISLNSGSINLKEINTRISRKQNIVLMEEEEEMDEESMATRAQFERKKLKLYNESFPIKKSH